MIELRQSPGGLWFQIDPERPFIRFKGPSPKSVVPPAMPPPAKQITQITEEAAMAGGAEGRRFRKKTGRRATRLTQPGLAGVPATVARAGLKTKLGART